MSDQRQCSGMFSASAPISKNPDRHALIAASQTTQSRDLTRFESLANAKGENVSTRARAHFRSDREVPAAHAGSGRGRLSPSRIDDLGELIYGDGPMRESSQQLATRFNGRREGPLVWRWTARRLAISAFLVFHLTATVVWNLPNSPLKQCLFPRMRPYMLPLGLWQSWWMFAPDPMGTTAVLEVGSDRRSGDASHL